ncbi:hypothetical protein LPJ66_006497 [Kickxella alabastrina]|uniref:Uncharacterized protein n=1 Tax=Kickxella alabastrina TaxID=61397 RepID=A0ACC1IFA0_9FUNG|nr:hypothetical protein LPJ66_006497 [Kickxella alabastrina]
MEINSDNSSDEETVTMGRVSTLRQPDSGDLTPVSPIITNSVERTVDGFSSPYRPNTLRLASIHSPGTPTKMTSAGAPRRSSGLGMHMLFPTVEKSTHPATKVVDRLQPKNPTPAAAVVTKNNESAIPQVKPSVVPITRRSAEVMGQLAYSDKGKETVVTGDNTFSSKKSRAQMADSYNPIIKELLPKKPVLDLYAVPQSQSYLPPPALEMGQNTLKPYLKPTGRAATRMSAQAAPLKAIPPKSILLQGVQIGKYFQAADLNFGRPISDHLRLHIKFVQQCFELSGLRDGKERMRFNASEIDVMEHREQDTLAILCIMPKDTMEQLFEESTFDPSSPNKELSRIVLCWSTESTVNKQIMSLLLSLLKGTVATSPLDIDMYKRYVGEFTKMSSIDLISSSDDERVDLRKRDDSNIDNDGLGFLTKPTLFGGVIGSSKAATPSSRRKSTPSRSSIWSMVCTERPGSPSKGRCDNSDDSDSSMNVSRARSKRRGTMGPSIGNSTPRVFSSIYNKSGYELRNTTRVTMSELSPNEEAEHGDLVLSDDDRKAEALQHKYRCLGQTRLFEYPPGGAKRISVTGSDISRLFANEFLNDTIIEFYMRYISENLKVSDPELFEQCFFFNTFFFRKLSHLEKSLPPSGSRENPLEQVHGRLKKWTANVNLFDKKYIFVPINERLHWYLAIIANPGELLKRATIVDDDKNDSAAGNPGGSAEEPVDNPAEDIIPKDDGQSDKDVDIENPDDSDHPTNTLSEYFGVKSSSKAVAKSVSASKHANGDAEMREASSPPPETSTEDLIRAVAAAKRLKMTNYEQGPSISAPVTAPYDIVDDVDMLSDDQKERCKSASPRSHEVIDLSSPCPNPRAGNRPRPRGTGLAQVKPPVVSLEFMGEVVDIPKSRYKDPLTRPSIIILDSLGSKHMQTFRLLRGFMNAEASSRYNVNTSFDEKGNYAKVPLQTNNCDCGVFLLHYIEQFLKSHAQIIELAVNSVPMQNWFESDLMKQKRSDMLALAIRLSDEHSSQKQKTEEPASLEPRAEADVSKVENSSGSATAPNPEVSESPPNEEPIDSTMDTIPESPPAVA